MRAGRWRWWAQALVLVALAATWLAVPANQGRVGALSAVNTNSCVNNVNGVYVDLDATTTGAGAPTNPRLGVDTVTVSGLSWSLFFPAGPLVAGYNLGLLTVGTNNIAGFLSAEIDAAPSVEGTLIPGATGIDLIDNFTGLADDGDPATTNDGPDGIDDGAIPVSGSITVTDPDGTRGTGDESATDLEVTASLPDVVFTPTAAGTMSLFDAGATLIAGVGPGGVIELIFDCEVATSIYVDPVTGVSDGGACLDATNPITCNDREPLVAVPFETVNVLADADPPPLPPASDCPSAGATVPFTDVNTASLSHRDDIVCIHQLGVTIGTSPTTYSPLADMTSQQMATFLARLYESITGGPAPVVAVPFTDMNTASVSHRTDIARIYGLGITTGTSPTTYSPLANVTREQMATFLARLYESITGGPAPVVAVPFTDMNTASVSHRADIARIYGLGVTIGTSPTTYSPLANVTRQQMASFLARLYRAVG